VKVIVSGIFCGYNGVKLQQFVVSEPDEVCCQCWAAIQQLSTTSCDKQVFTPGTLWHQHYIRTSKNIQLTAVFCRIILN